MGVYIDAESIQKRAYKMRFAMRITERELALINYLLTTPSKANTLEIVRCGECKWWDSDDGNIGYCHAEKHCHFSKNWEISIYRTYKADHYCSDGERRTNE